LSSQGGKDVEMIDPGGVIYSNALYLDPRKNVSICD